MLLDVYVGNRMHQIELAPAVLDDDKTLFDKMDGDMDAGWKIGPQFVESPNRVQRGQIAAARLLVAIETGNEAMVQAMAGYIASRLPEVRSLNIDLNGEPLNTEMITDTGRSVT